MIGNVVYWGTQIVYVLFIPFASIYWIPAIRQLHPKFWKQKDNIEEFPFSGERQKWKGLKRRDDYIAF